MFGLCVYVFYYVCPIIVCTVLFLMFVSFVFVMPFLFVLCLLFDRFVDVCSAFCWWLVYYYVCHVCYYYYYSSVVSPVSSFYVALFLCVVFLSKQPQGGKFHCIYMMYMLLRIRIQS